MSLQFAIVELNLCVTSSGQLVPWIGPALRGLTAGRLKAMTCRRTDEQGNRPDYCEGCRFHEECPYGQLYEPPSPPDDSEALRPLVLSPYYPTAKHVRSGDELPVRMILIGEKAIAWLPTVMGALTDVGRKPSLGPDEIHFIPRQLFMLEGRLDPSELPPTPDSIPGTFPRVGIGLRTPLILRRRDERGQRHTIQSPTFGDVFTAAKIVLCRAFAQAGTRLSADLDALQAAANQVECREDYFRPFQQIKWSSRTSQRFELFGCVGGAVYRDVPAAFIPWIYWAGLFHVGGHRVAGGGSWRVILD